MAYDAEMERVASALNMKVEELQAKMAEARTREQGAERRLAAEIAMKQRTGDSSGGAVR